MFVLPSLPYSYSSLEPFIDEGTMKLHHDKHHAGYVEKLNKALEGNKDLLDMSIGDLLGSIDKVPEGSRQNVINNGGGHANHNLFWETMISHSDALAEPNDGLADAIKSTFGSFSDFKEKFAERAMGVFGSGWVFLIVSDGKLALKRHSFQNSPYLHGNMPILGLDLWEHAYYLKYQNRKHEYIESWWNVVNWQKVNENFKKVLSI